MHGEGGKSHTIANTKKYNSVSNDYVLTSNTMHGINLFIATEALYARVNL